MAVAETGSVFDLTSLQYPGETTVALAVSLFEKTEPMFGRLAVFGLVQNYGGNRVYVNKPARSDEMFGHPIENRTVIKKLIDVTAIFPINTYGMVKRDNALYVIAKESGITK